MSAARSAFEAVAAPERAVPRAARWLVLLVPVAAGALVAWTFSPRLGLRMPAIVDDWVGLRYSTVAVHELAHGAYDASLVDFGGRFRPTYFLWGYLQWHAPGGSSILFPDLWGAFRVLAFLGVVGVITALLVRRRASPAWTVTLATAAAASLALTPRTAVDLAGFGAEQPLMIAALGAGLVLVADSTRRLTCVHSASLRVAAAAEWLAGYVAYLFGVYMWEMSATTIVLLPFLYRWLAREGSRRGEGGRRTARYATASLALLALPLVHQAFELIRAVDAHPAYAHGTAGGAGGLLRVAAVALLATAIGMVIGLGMPIWAFVFVPVLRSAVKDGRSGDPTNQLCLGILVTGTAMSVGAHVAHLTPSRYLLPWLTALVVVGAVQLTRLDGRTRASLLGILLSVLLVGNAHGSVRDWTRIEQSGSAAIELAGSIDPARCAVYLSNFPPDRRLGLSRLLGYGQGSAGRSCGPSTAYVLDWGVPRRSPRFPATCSGAWRQVETRRDVRLFACRAFSATKIVLSQDDAADRGGISLVRLVEPSRLVPLSTLMSVGGAR